jgi:hypothetical protein
MPDSKNSTEYKWNEVVYSYRNMHWSKSYKNGDAARIDLRVFENGPVNYDWYYSDGADCVLKAGWTTDLLEAKSACDDLNLTFPEDWES